VTAFRLSAVETSFITGETNARPAHIGNLALFEQSPNGPLTYDAVKKLVSERLDLVPAFRRRIVGVPFGLDRPYAVDDDSLDVEFHVRQIGVPAPGAREELADIVARLHARPLDRSRPLWELYVIEGVEGGRVGLYSKVHFVAVDPAHGTEIMTALLDSTPEGGSERTPPARRQPSRAPTQLEMLAAAGLSLVRRPRHLLWLQREMARRVGRSAGEQLPVAAEAYRETLHRTRGLGGFARFMGDRREAGNVQYLSRPAARGPRVSFNRRITPHRRVGFASLPFDDVHAIKQAAGTTVHDVVMAICAGGVRRWLIARRELPTEPLLAAVPILVRGDSNDNGLADHVSMMIARLPTDEADPRERLAKAHDAMRVAKDRHDAVPANVLGDMTRYAPPAVAGLAARLVGAVSIDEMASPPFNLTISNVPGPRHPVYCGGSRLVANYPLSVLSEGVGLHISLVTYDNKLHLGVVTCRDALPSQWELVDDIVESLHELRSAVVGEQAES
jgi:diacylglycerol O-acyltransferase / wax synthase